MKVAFELTVPSFSQVTGTYTWHHATILCEALELTCEQVFAIIQEVLNGSKGSRLTILRLAQTLHQMAGDAPVQDVWEPAGFHDLPFDPKMRVKINYDTEKVVVDFDESVFGSFQLTSTGGLR